MDEQKVTEACHRIEELYYETQGKCCVSFSGGKDSTVLLALIKLCEDIYTIPQGGIPAVFCNTGIELGVTVDFVRWARDNWYSNVRIIRPTVSFDHVLKTEGKPMLSKLKSEYLNRWHRGQRTECVMQNLIRGKTNSGKKTWKLKLADKDTHMLHDAFPIQISERCCKRLKKEPFEKLAKTEGMRGNILGLRMGEGGAREMNARIRQLEGRKICTAISKSGFIKKTPIVDWSDQDVEDFIKDYQVPLSRAYTEHKFHRTGCMLCPFSRQLASDLGYLWQHESNRYKASMHWLKDVYIAQNVVLPFDEAYERERERTWRELYEPMRQEMLRKWRPHSKLIKDSEQLTIFDVLED